MFFVWTWIARILEPNILLRKSSRTLYQRTRNLPCNDLETSGINKNLKLIKKELLFYQMPKSNGKTTIKWGKIKVWLTITQFYISNAYLLKLQMTQTVYKFLQKYMYHFAKLLYKWCNLRCVMLVIFHMM